MSFTTDPTTNIGKVRLLIQDTNAAKPIFDDDTQITAFLNLEGDDVKSAAALALETIAGSQAFLLKVIQTLEIKTDGAKVAEALLKVAQRLRDTSGDSQGGYFAEVTDNSWFAYEEKVWKDLLEESA